MAQEAKYKIQEAPSLPLTEACHHWTEIEDVPWDLHKYWQQRYTIFPYYDDGIRLTEDAWYGVTPEPVATRIVTDLFRHSTLRTSKTPAKETLIDAFAGVGANTIAFALAGHWRRVIGIERDAATLACAQNNARLYGVADRITWVHGDSFAYFALLARPDEWEDGLAPALRIGEGALSSTVVFASPPWGGPGYRTGNEVFNLHTMEPYGLESLHGAYRAFDHALYLPRTGDLRQIAKLVSSASADGGDGAPTAQVGQGNGENDGTGQATGEESGKEIDVIQYCVEGASKAMVAYIPGQYRKSGGTAEELAAEDSLMT